MLGYNQGSNLFVCSNIPSQAEEKKNAAVSAAEPQQSKRS